MARSRYKRSGAEDMIFSYYPGCTLSTKAKDLDKFGRLSAEALGVKLEEIENQPYRRRHTEVCILEGYRILLFQ